MGNPNEGFREQDERDLELQGLLSGVRAPNKEQRARKEKKGLALYSWLEDDDNEGQWSRRRLAGVAALLILLLLGAALLNPLLAPKARSSRTHPHPNSQFTGKELRSNGTHDFKRTVLLFSIDGLRCVLLPFLLCEVCSTCCVCVGRTTSSVV